APVLIPVFGSVPLVSLPANLLAVPLAGPLTIWGLAAGLVGGALRPVAPPVARLLQGPTLVPVPGVVALAPVRARAPIALGATAAIALVTAAAGVWAARRMLGHRGLVVPPG